MTCTPARAFHRICRAIIPGCLLMLCACVNSPRVIHPLFHWTRSGCAEADSLLADFEINRNGICPETVIRNAGYTDKMRRLAQKHSNPLLDIWADYLELVIERTDSTDADNLAYACRTLAKTDSAAYPYEWHMIRQKAASIESDCAKCYDIL